MRVYSQKKKGGHEEEKVNSVFSVDIVIFSFEWSNSVSHQVQVDPSRVLLPPRLRDSWKFAKLFSKTRPSLKAHV